MKNPKLKGLVSNFARTMNLNGDEPDNFQKYINYLMFRKYYYDINGLFPYNSLFDSTFLSNIDFDNDEECGMAVDGCFLISDKYFVHLDMTESEIKNELDKMQGSKIHVVLIQTKSGDFQTDELNNLSTCLRSEYDGQSRWSALMNLRKKLSETLQADARTEILFHVIFVCGKKMKTGLHGTSTFDVKETDLRESMKDYLWTNDDSVSIDYYGEDEILSEIEKQDKTIHAKNVMLKYQKMTDSITCEGHGDVKFGVIKISELLKLLIDETTGMTNELYNYNVRDKIENSDVNSEIITSLKDKSDYFLLLNNGVTMVVSKQEKRGDDGIQLEEVRIVNGCQTCHSIIEAKRKGIINGDTLIAIRIVQPIRENLLGEITYASNRQNPVKKSNLFAIRPEIMQLEQYYKDFFISYQQTNFRTVYLERRQGQYSDSTTSHIDMLTQAKTYVALWKLSPNKAIQYNEQTLTDYQNSLDKTDICEKSFFCGTVWNSIVEMIDRNYHNARYHIFTIVALKILGISNEFNELQSQLDRLKGSEIIDKLINDKQDLEKCIRDVINAIDMLTTNFPKTSTGNIHYRKFYPTDTLQIIYNKYLELL